MYAIVNERSVGQRRPTCWSGSVVAEELGQALARAESFARAFLTCVKHMKDLCYVQNLTDERFMQKQLCVVAENVRNRLRRFRNICSKGKECIRAARSYSSGHEIISHWRS